MLMSFYYCLHLDQKGFTKVHNVFGVSHQETICDILGDNMSWHRCVLVTFITIAQVWNKGHSQSFVTYYTAGIPLTCKSSLSLLHIPFLAVIRFGRSLFYGHWMIRLKFVLTRYVRNLKYECGNMHHPGYLIAYICV